ncbi:MAG: M1 family peptidase [Bacteroidetes bacterium]|nr:MAG: M1 family peptidase [Bacteroidota bacterium]
MKKTVFLSFCLLTSYFLLSQDYRSSSNPHYWKNTPPFAGYWQQDVHYKIKANIDEKTNIISATEDLIYYNNSPDTLTFVYFHLYQNAFQPGSYFDKMTRENGVTPKYGTYEAQKKNTEILKLTTNGAALKTETDNTLVRVWLTKSLLPNDSVSFSISFNSYFDTGTQRRRMKTFNVFGNKHFDGVHWYPRMAVYDRKFGWETDQHIEKEFYGDFGTYDVELTFSSNYIVEATGELINKNEAMPDELRKKLDLSNFKGKPMFSAPSIIIPYDSAQRKTWKYHAINVHDFAFTADPTYRIGEVTLRLAPTLSKGEGVSPPSGLPEAGNEDRAEGVVKVIALAQEPVAARWQNAAEYTAKVIQTYSEDIGMYLYPKIVVADAKDGMEYPMLTLDGGWDPNYRDLIAHEVGHNWFFGMIGTNETYRAFMDEGFTQFLTCWAYEKIDGKIRLETETESKYVKEFTQPDYIRNSEAYTPYMLDAIKGEETNINRHSNDFGTALRHGGGYRNVYFKTAVMLYNLQYVLGDELFLKAIQHYFDQWKIAHPYPEDFRNSIIQYTHADLNWFFDQWLETSKTINYEIESVKAENLPGEYTITFEREGPMQMPIDFTVTDQKDSTHKFHIPNTWYVKKADATTVLPKWFGWDKIQPSYEARVKIPEGIKKVVIDPSNRLADIDMRNNRFPAETNYFFDSKVVNYPDWTHYELYSRPDIWYNRFDGLKAGVHLNGNFVDHYDLFDANIWINSGLGQGSIDTSIGKNDFNSMSFRLNYKTATDWFAKYSSINFSAKYLDGLNAYTAGFEKRDKENENKIYGTFKSMIRQRTEDLHYLLNPNDWDAGKLNNSVLLGYEHAYTYKRGTGKINLDLRSSTVMSDYDFANIRLSVINKNRLGKFNFNTRTIAQYGTGSNIPKESALYLAGASPEELQDNKFVRSAAFFPSDWMGYGANTNSFQMGGGLNLRGYAGYLVPEETENGSVRFVYRGNSGAAINSELEFDQLFRFIRITDQNGIIKWAKKTFKLNTYLFGDIGVINYNAATEDFKLADFRADAGLGAALTIKKWGDLQTVHPLTIRFDMPFFLNRIPATENEYVKFRWLVGISRAF